MLQSVHQKYQNSDSEENSEGVGDKVVNVKPAVGEEVLQHFCAGREEKSQEEPPPEGLPHGLHKESPRHENKSMGHIVAAYFYDHDVIQVQFATRFIDG